MKIIDYIQNNCWCDFKNNNRTLLYRSIYNYGISKYKSKFIENQITETITVFYPNNRKQVHAFNGNQPPINQKSLQTLKANDLNHFIEKYNKIRKKIEIVSKNIEGKEDFFNVKQIRKIIELEANLYSYEYLISNFANKIQKKMDSKTYTNFIAWKNNPNNKEPWIYNEVLKKILKLYEMNLSLKLLKQYIHFQELLNILEGKENMHMIVDKIEKRKKEGFLLLNFRNSHYQNRIIVNRKIIEETRKYLELIEKDSQSTGKEIYGKPTFPFDLLEGECVILTNNNFTNEDIFNKIVVCSILTTQETINLIDSRGILVEYGGYLSHASIWSREYRKPCLVGCKNITKILNNGDTIQINGKSGLISVTKKTTK